LTSAFASSEPGSAASPEEARAAKRRLRSLCQQMRDELGAPYQRQASDLISAQIEAWEPFRNAGVVLSFLPMRGEVDLRPLIFHFPQKRWAIPRVVEGPRGTWNSTPIGTTASFGIATGCLNPIRPYRKSLPRRPI